jgi:hypothetical protein
MADISKINGVDIGDIAKINGADKGDLEKFNTGEVPASQSDPANVDMTSGDNDHPNGTGQTYGPASCVATISGTQYLCVAYADGDDGNKAKVRIATWNGSALSWGDETTIHSSGSSYANGICFDPNNDRIIGSFMVSNGGANYNDYHVYGAGIATAGSGAPKLENIDDVSDVYHPYDDGSSTNYNQTGKHVGNMIYDDNADRGLMFFEKGGPDSGSSHGGDYHDFVVASVTFDDVSSNNNITVSDLSVVKDEGDEGYASYDQLRNRIVYLTQDESGTYQAEAGTITGTGATHTVASPTLYADQSIIAHGNFNSGSSLSGMVFDTHMQKIVFDDTNNVHHVLMWDDVVNDWIVTNFSVGADNSITWATANSQPLRSNGLIDQFAGAMTQGITDPTTMSYSHGDGQPYFSVCIGYSSKRGRLVITGPSTDDSSTNTQRAVGLVYSPTTGYNYTGNYHTVLTNAQGAGGYKIATPSGSHSTDETFLGGGVVFFHYSQNNVRGGIVYGYDPGVGQRTASGGVFSASNATLSTARTRCNGFGTSRIASMVVGGQNTSGTYLDTGEEYNGSVVTAAGDTLSAAKNQPGSCGTLTAGLVQGGYIASGGSSTSDEYDGTNFTSGGTATTVGGDGSRVAGTQTDALAAGGYKDDYVDEAESYNGTAWGAEADPPATVSYGAMAGTGQGDAYYFGGYSGSSLSVTYKYNGTAWETLNSMSNARTAFQGGGTGLDFLLFGGGRIANDDGEIWNGTSWASSATNGLSSHDLYSGTPDTDCGGTSALVSFGGGTTMSGSSGQNKIVHHDR